MDERDYKFMNNELNMEIIIDKKTLTYVREENRVQGNWYIVLDKIITLSTPLIVQWHSNDRSMDAWGGQSVKFNFWFEIPPNLPGFPKAELPDEIDLEYGGWEYYNIMTRSWEKSIRAKYRRIKSLPQLTIPSGTRSEQIEAVKKILAELETK